MLEHTSTKAYVQKTWLKYYLLSVLYSTSNFVMTSYPSGIWFVVDNFNVACVHNTVLYLSCLQVSKRLEELKHEYEKKNGKLAWSKAKQNRMHPAWIGKQVYDIVNTQISILYNAP